MNLMHLVNKLVGHDIQMAYYLALTNAYTSLKYMLDDMMLIRS